MMADRPRDLSRVSRQIADLYDGTLDSAEFHELEMRIENDPLARQVYFDYVALHVLLERKHEPALKALTAVELESVCSASPILENVQKSQPILSQEDHDPDAIKRKHINSLALLALACSFMAVIGLVAISLSPSSISSNQENEFVAVLTKTYQARWLTDPPVSTPMRLTSGQSLQLVDGLAELTFSSGAVVLLRGPAHLDIISPMRVRASSGTVRARVGKDAQGFVIETPDANVTDLGTEFGVEVKDGQGTDVVVFEGAVDLTYDDQLTQNLSSTHASRNNQVHARNQFKRLESGEALHVNSLGLVSRIVSITSEDYPHAINTNAVTSSVPKVIVGVNDNIRDTENAQYYQIVHHGLYDDSRAYVDRFHEWNGVDSKGIPSELIGADYVMTFNSDKWQSGITIEVDLSCPSRLYLFYDNRLPVPAWIKNAFIDTGMQIGIDEGYQDPAMRELNAVGPGMSIDKTFTVWKKDVLEAGKVSLGALSEQLARASMYGIAATPLKIDNSAAVIPSKVDPNKLIQLKHIHTDRYHQNSTMLMAKSSG